MKNIVIIGASSGIGLSLAQLQAAEGFDVYGTFHKSKDVSSHSFKEIRQLNVLDDSLDLSFVPDTIDGLAYCPGSVTLKPFNRFTPQDFMADYQLQLIGAVRVIQALLPKLKNSASPSIVLFSTVAVQAGFNFHALVSSSKGAVEGLTKALAAEFAPKVRVNCIAPSITDTPLAAFMLNSEEKKAASANRHPLKKIGSPTDVAALAAFLLSEKSSWMTGQVIHLDGGISTLKV